MLQNSDMRIETSLIKDSSFINKISWFEDGNILMLTFATGSIWAYFEVPLDIYYGLINAESHGNYFNRMIRNKYLSKRLSYVTEPDEVTVSNV